MGAPQEQELLPIAGIGPATAKLLVASGVAGLAGLAAADPAVLAGLEGLPPNADTAAWIEAAKERLAQGGETPPAKVPPVPLPLPAPTIGNRTTPVKVSAKPPEGKTRRFPVEWDLRIHGKLFTPNKRGPELTKQEHADLLASGVIATPWSEGTKTDG